MLRLLKWCDRKAITLVPVHLPGVHNIQADSLSRVGQTLNTEWTMAMERLRPVFAQWGEPQVDLFVTFANRQIIKFASPYPDPRVEFMDSISVPWDNRRVSCRPFHQSGWSLKSCRRLLNLQVFRWFAPLQEAASWFPELLDLSQEDPIPLYVEGQPLLAQDVAQCSTGGQRLVTTGRQIFTRGDFVGHPGGEGPFPWCQGPFENHHCMCMNLTGRDSFLSVRRKDGMCSESFQYLHDAPVQRRITPIDDNFTAHVCGFCVTSLDPAADPHIKLLIRAFRLECPVQHRIMPMWDLHLVHLALMRPPFASECGDQGETSDDVILWKWRTMKTVFLLALVSARRHSYIRALSVAPGRCVFSRGNTQCQLMVSLLQMAKTQLPLQAPQWISIPGIAHLNPSEAERMLCPVRQLKLYLRDSESGVGGGGVGGGVGVGGRQRLFIHWNRTIRGIMRSHISRWIVETFKEAYTRANRKYDRVTAHEIRALSASWAYNELSGGATWRSVSCLLEVVRSFPEFLSTRFIGTAPLEVSWEVISADGLWRLSKRLTHELIGSTTELQHMRSEPCQPHGLTMNCQVVLPDVLSAAFWRSSGVFQNSYLRDMACIADGMSTLGPVVVAQQVVDPGHLLPPP